MTLRWPGFLLTGRLFCLNICIKLKPMRVISKKTSDAIPAGTRFQAARNFNQEAA